jgi:hypothetical protein
VWSGKLPYQLGEHPVCTPFLSRLFTGGVKWNDEPRHSRDRWGFHPSEYRREPMFRWPERREQHQ